MHDAVIVGGGVAGMATAARLQAHGLSTIVFEAHGQAGGCAGYMPHHDYGDTPLTQTSSLRGRLIPTLFLELTYHLEHHLYPTVPSHHLPELARRLDPFFQKAGVKTRRVP